jgi:hypothetical protein
MAFDAGQIAAVFLIAVCNRTNQTAPPSGDRRVLVYNKTQNLLPCTSWHNAPFAASVVNTKSNFSQLCRRRLVNDVRLNASREHHVVDPSPVTQIRKLTA